MWCAQLRVVMKNLEQIVSLNRTCKANALDEQSLIQVPLISGEIAAGNPESIKTMLALYPESERLKVLNQGDFNGQC